MEEDQGLIDLVLKMIKEKLTEQKEKVTPQGNMEIGKINKNINYKCKPIQLLGKVCILFI